MTFYLETIFISGVNIHKHRSNYGIFYTKNYLQKKESNIIVENYKSKIFWRGFYIKI